MHGKGEFTFPDGKSDVGVTTWETKREGYGVYKWDGKVYEGDWVAGKMHGFGFLSSAAGGEKSDTSLARTKRSKKLHLRTKLPLIYDIDSQQSLLQFLRALPVSPSDLVSTLCRSFSFSETSTTRAYRSVPSST